MTLNALPNGHYSKSLTPKQPILSGCVVQKYGGTSVGKFAREIVAHVIKPSLVKGHIAVVCSAMSATVKADGTTNRYALLWGILQMKSANHDSDYCRHRKRPRLLGRTVSANLLKMFDCTILPSPSRISEPQKSLRN